MYFEGFSRQSGVVQFGADLPNRTAPYDFASNTIAPERTVGFLEYVDPFGACFMLIIVWGKC